MSGDIYTGWVRRLVYPRVTGAVEALPETIRAVAKQCAATRGLIVHVDGNPVIVPTVRVSSDVTGVWALTTPEGAAILDGPHAHVGVTLQ